MGAIYLCVLVRSEEGQLHQACRSGRTGYGRPRKDEEASPERKAAASVKEFRYPLIKNSENQTER